MTRTRDEWVSRYEKKTGGKFQPEPDEQILFHPEHGFVTYFLNFKEKCLEIHYAVGDGKFWQEQITLLMRALGFEKARFFTRRDPRAWIRRYGGHIRGYYMEVGIDEAKV